MSRDKAIEELKRLISEQRARIDPRLLKIAERLATAKQQSEDPDAKTVPYDRKAAAEAIELFLKNKSDEDDFKKKLIAFLVKNSQ